MIWSTNTEQKKPFLQDKINKCDSQQHPSPKLKPVQTVYKNNLVQ